MEKNIGFIGLGIMGERMARNLLAAGFEVTVYNRTASKAAGLEAAGATVAESPLAVGRRNDTVIMMLTGPEAIDAVLAGDSGLLAEGSKCRSLINMSTVPPHYTRELAARLQAKGVTLIDAPVSGSKKPAEEGALVILAGGPKDTVAALEQVLLKMGKKVVYCGEAGKGSAMKMVINLLLGTMLGGLAEALALGEKCGLETGAMLETVLAGPLGCPLFAMKADMFRSGDYPVQFPFRHMLKDLNFIVDTAQKTGAAAKLGQTLRDLYVEGMGQGLGELDFAAVRKVMEG